MGNWQKNRRWNLLVASLRKLLSSPIWWRTNSNQFDLIYHRGRQKSSFFLQKDSSLWCGSNIAICKCIYSLFLFVLQGVPLILVNYVRGRDLKRSEAAKTWAHLFCLKKSSSFSLKWSNFRLAAPKRREEELDPNPNRFCHQLWRVAHNLPPLCTVVPVKGVIAMKIAYYSADATTRLNLVDLDKWIFSPQMIMMAGQARNR